MTILVILVHLCEREVHVYSARVSFQQLNYFSDQIVTHMNILVYHTSFYIKANIMYCSYIALSSLKRSHCSPNAGTTPTYSLRRKISIILIFLWVGEF
jgi:hypothetical protein